jgi:hypothetical protein
VAAEVSLESEPPAAIVQSWGDRDEPIGQVDRDRGARRREKERVGWIEGWREKNRGKKINHGYSRLTNERCD